MRFAALVAGEAQTLEGVPGVGQVVAGKYRVEFVIGVGGMGAVLAARHMRLGQRVALKFLLAEAACHPAAIERFFREAMATVAIQSEHVARVVDVGQLDGGTAFIVMEYLVGSDLAAVLGERKRLPIDEAVDYVVQACEAIVEAHAAGIVHRDLKPSNLFLTSRADGSPLVKVLDFGISKAPAGDGSAKSLTATRDVMGTPLYMSPEQLKSSRDVDARADVWALGAILHELCTGAPVFGADNVGAILAKVMTEAPPPLRSLLPDAPIELERLLLRCLEKDPARRIADVGELARGVAPFARAHTIASIERIVRIAKRTMGIAPALPVAMPEPQPATGNAWGTTGQPRARSSRRYPTIIASGVVLLCAATLVIAITRHSSPPNPPPIGPASSMSGDATGPPLASPPSLAVAETTQVAPAPTPEPTPALSASASASASPRERDRAAGRPRAPAPTTSSEPDVGF